MTRPTELYGPSTVKRHRRSRTELAELDSAIVAAVETEHPVSLRGVYYRVVSASAIEKTENGYRAVGRRLLELRRAGTVPYSSITDGTRWVIKPDSYSDVETMLADAAASYRRALWRDQPVDVHVFTEKDAISGVILPVTERWDVPLGVLRGYCSETFAHSVAESIRSSYRPTYIYQLGDHDPSGLDAWRDFQSKVARFAPDSVVIFTRLTVTERQITELGLPTRPTKRSDSRAKSFLGGSVEVDAIPAPTWRALVEEAVTRHIDGWAWTLTQEVEAQERDLLTAMVEGGWPA